MANPIVITPQIPKDPNANLDYGWDWSDWLNGDTIVSATVFAVTGLTIASQSYSTTAVVAWISGGSAGQPYTVTAKITTAAGRIDERSITIYVVNR